MGKSQETFSKKEKEKKRKKKKEDKKKKAAERRANSAGGGLDNMMAYIDENGNIVDTPPDPTKKQEINAEDIEIGVPKRDKAENLSIKTGIVDFFNDEKGYGFIKDNQSKEKFFFHIKGVIGDEIKQNDKVNFELEKGVKGMNAVNVMIL